MAGQPSEVIGDHMWSKLTDIFSKLWTNGGTDRHNDLYFLLVTDLNKSLMIALIFILKCFYFLIDFHCKVSFCNLQSHSGGMDGGLAEVNIQKKLSSKSAFTILILTIKISIQEKKAKPKVISAIKIQDNIVLLCFVIMELKNYVF